MYLSDRSLSSQSLETIYRDVIVFGLRSWLLQELASLLCPDIYAPFMLPTHMYNFFFFVVSFNK